MKAIQTLFFKIRARISRPEHNKFRPVLTLIRACRVVLFLNSALVLRATPGNEHWDAQFGAPGVTNVIFAIAANQGIVYVGGQSPSGGRTNTPLSMWDGKQWSVPAIFVGPTIVSIFDLAFVGNTLYVAGNFTNVAGVTARGLAKYDGTNWSSIGFSGTANALAVDGNNLYVGGNYTNTGAGGVMLTNIGYWDGTAWQAMGSLPVLSSLYTVKAVAVHNGLVYAGGLFINNTTQMITNVAVWNGSTWSGVGGGILSSVSALAFYNDDLYVGGMLTIAGGVAVSGIAKWDGSNWSTLNGGMTGSGVSSMAVYNGKLYVTGGFAKAGGVSATNFAAWDGSSWSTGGSLNSTGSRLVAGGGKLYLGGSFAIAGGVWVNEIATWDGSQLGSLDTFRSRSGIQAEVSALASDGTNIYAGGFFLYAGRTNASFIARFDGTNWFPLGAGLNNQVRALAVTNNLVYAGGFFTGTTDGHPLTYIGCWDGTNWNSIGNPDGLGVVYALAVGTNGLYAAGTYYTGTQYGSPYFSRWDGTNWNGMFNFIPNSTLFAVPLSDPIGYDCIALQGTNVYMGGNIQGFTQFDPNSAFDPATNCKNIMRFDGTYGYIMGTGLNNTNYALAALGTNLYAGGLFTQAGGIPANQIAKWDGNTWSAVGGGVVGSGTVQALTTLGNNLYAAGTFTNMGGVPANRIAKWDGTNWSALGDGTSGFTEALAAAGSNLFAAGTFRLAGGKNSFAIARWNERQNFHVPQLFNPAWTTNGQFLTRLSGIGGLTNIIQATTNFTTWTPVLTNTTGIYDFTDPNSAAYRSRFYRAVLGP